MKVPASISHQARERCPESDEHHDRVWFCMTCKAIEQRLMPIDEVLAPDLSAADLTIELWR